MAKTCELCLEPDSASCGFGPYCNNCGEAIIKVLRLTLGVNAGYNSDHAVQIEWWELPELVWDVDHKTDTMSLKTKPVPFRTLKALGMPSSFLEKRGLT